MGLLFVFTQTSRGERVYKFEDFYKNLNEVWELNVTYKFYHSLPK